MNRGAVLIGFVLSVATLIAQEKTPPKVDPFARWEPAITAFEKRDAVTMPPKNGILFVGSSSIVGWKLDRFFPDLLVINRGFGGSQIADSVHFAERIITNYEPRIIVFYAGDNDIAAKRTPEQCRDAFRELVKIVHAKLPKTQIIFLSIKASPSRWKMVEAQKQANTMIADDCARDERLKFLDLVTPLLGKDGMPRMELFKPDGLHLNDDGYQIWTEKLVPLLN